MPFLRHFIQPQHLMQGLPPKGEEEKTTLHEYANLTLVNIIRQLASLNERVDMIFGNLMTVSEDLNRRLKELKSKIEAVEQNVKELDSNEETVGKGIGKDRKAAYKRIANRSNFFESQRLLDTGLFMEKTTPSEVKLMYEKAEAMPRLQDLDNYRMDGKLCTKFYSNPHLFFLAWQDSVQAMITEQHSKSLMKAKKTVRQTNIRRVRKAKASRIIEAQKYKMGKELATAGTDPTDEDEYFSDEEWSDSGSDDDVMLSPTTSRNVLQNGNSIPNGGLSVKTTKKQYRLSSFHEYKLEDIDLNRSNDFAEAHSPPVSINSLDFPPPPMHENYGGQVGEYNVQSSLDSMNAIKREDEDYFSDTASVITTF